MRTPDSGPFFFTLPDFNFERHSCAHRLIDVFTYTLPCNLGLKDFLSTIPAGEKRLSGGDIVALVVSSFAALIFVLTLLCILG